MSAAEEMDRIRTGLSPQTLRDLILSLASKQPIETRASVTLVSLMDTLTEGTEAGEGAEAWQAQLRLKRAIIALVGQIEGMRFFEGDS